MPGTSATLGGVQLLQEQVLGWRLQAGVAPSQRIFLIAPEDARILLSGNAGSTSDGGNQIASGGAGPDATVSGGGGASGPIELVISPDGADPLRVRGLYVLGAAPSPDPRHVAVLVSDRRFLWPRTWVLRRYNYRRRTGDVGLRAGNLVTAQFAADVGYAKFSTEDGAGAYWKANEILQDVLQTVDPDLVISSDTQPSERGSMRLEGMYFDDPGDEAIARALAAIPGANCFLDVNDNLVLFDTTAGNRTADVLSSLGPPTPASGIAALVDTPGLRPRYIDVLLEREIEARIDALADGTTTTDTGVHFLSSIADNVIEVTDQQLTLADGRVVAMGQYITFAEFFAAMYRLPQSAYPPAMQARGLKLDESFVRKTWFGGLAQYNMSFGGLGEDPVWLRRLGAVFIHYRQTYRITRDLMDRFLTIQAKRVGVVDAPQGMSAKAQVFADHAEYARQKSSWYTSQAAGAPFVANMSDGWAASIGSATPASPAELSIVDGETGIFRCQFGLAQGASFGTQLIPCQVQTKAGADPSATAGGVGLLLTDCELSPTHKLAVILTITPAAPNSKRQFHRVRVLPSDAEKYLGQKVGNAAGPPLEVRIPGSTLPARVPWVDSQAALLEQALGMDSPSGTPNDDYVDLPIMNDSDVKALAAATAAAYWSLYLPQYEGTQSGFFNPKVEPAGRAMVVEHRLSPRGIATTTVAATLQSQPRDPLSALPDSVRQTILRYAKVAPR